MSDTDRKSMDDVLASIRRIVRSDNPDAGPGESGSEAFSADAAEEPLLLTPDMRTDGGAEAAVAIADYADADDVFYPRAGSPPPDALQALVRAVLIEELGGGSARDAVREIIRGELIDGEIGDNVSRNVVRLVRDEVTRLTGQR